MGRYYSGDIDGKFWFALQSSDCADRFGVTGEQPNFLNYYFDEDNLEDVEDEIKNIEESLGEKFQTIVKFFEENIGYNDKMLVEAGITQDELKDYADLELGKKIRDCIKENGICSFEAEC
jgi:translation initiation factor 2 alpha subunit (eIF-2alpha)